MQSKKVRKTTAYFLAVAVICMLAAISLSSFTLYSLLKRFAHFDSGEQITKVKKPCFLNIIRTAVNKPKKA